MRTHARTHTHTHIYSHTHADAMRARFVLDTMVFWRTHIHAYTLKRTHTHTDTHRHTQTRTHRHEDTHSHTHINPHTHTTYCLKGLERVFHVRIRRSSELGGPEQSHELVLHPISRPCVPIFIYFLFRTLFVGRTVAIIMQLRHDNRFMRGYARTSQLILLVCNFFFGCVCICMFVCTYIYIYVYIHIYLCMYMYTHSYV